MAHLRPGQPKNTLAAPVRICRFLSNLTPIQTMANLTRTKKLTMLRMTSRTQNSSRHAPSTPYKTRPRKRQLHRLPVRFRSLFTHTRRSPPSRQLGRRPFYLDSLGRSSTVCHPAGRSGPGISHQDSFPQNPKSSRRRQPPGF